MNVGVRVGVGDGVGVEVGVEVVVGVFVSVGLRGGSGVDVSTGIGQGGVGELSAEDGAEQRPTKNAVAANTTQAIRTPIADETATMLREVVFIETLLPMSVSAKASL